MRCQGDGGRAEGGRERDREIEREGRRGDKERVRETK